MKELQKTILELSETFKDSSKEEVIAALADTTHQLAKATDEAGKAGKDVKELNEKLAKATAELVEAGKDVAALNEKLSAYESGKKVKAIHPTVKLGKDVYEITNPTVKVKGTVYTAAQIRENKVKIGEIGIAEHLLQIGSGVLVLKTV